MRTMTDTSTKTENAELRKQLKALLDKRPYHLHEDPESGERWTCHSPYCKSIITSKKKFDEFPPEDWE